jgi:hypothetical protein
MHPGRNRLSALACALTLSIGCASAQAASSHLPDPVYYNGLEDDLAGPVDRRDAARFLAQATFGPTDADIAHLSQVGYTAWLNEQYAASPSSFATYLNWVGVTLAENTGSSHLREAWFLGALGGPDPANNLVIHSDQLRQRVAFALSEIFVVSNQNTMLDQHPRTMAAFYDILSNNAFGNYRVLLEQVTLSPAMGVYLNMMTNHRANLLTNLHPDENYAREINQLFSIGLVMLDNSGAPVLTAGKPTPTYNQATITNFAHVFTGWTWSSCGAANFDSCGIDNSPNNETFPMTPVVAQHDNGTQANNDIVNKQLLSYPNAASGGLLGPNGTPNADLAFALDNIFNHPNVGPYIGKQLIQRLVTSNPSPAYVQRITSVFNDDGTPGHVRGNLKAVVSAILLDPEARNGQMAAPTTYGKLREPLLRITHLWRAMGAQHHCGFDITAGGRTAHYANQPYRYAGYATAYGTDDTIYGSGVGQAPLNADTVFNFFKPSYLPPGEMAVAGLLGPEFEINTDVLSTNSANSTFNKTWGYDLTDVCADAVNDPIGNVKINHAQDAALAGNTVGGPDDPANRLVDAYNLRFMSGQMSGFMRETLLAALNPVSQANQQPLGNNWRTERVKRALLLILTSPEYMVQK